MDSVEAVAYPGLPVVFAEGCVGEDRLCGHGHASLALTSMDESVRTETRIEPYGEDVFLINGEPAVGARIEAAWSIINDVRDAAGVEGGLRVKSRNRGIKSGSSDSGAAALVIALNEFYGLGLEVQDKCSLACKVSETAYRSIIGGLSVHEKTGEGLGEYQLLGAEELSGLAVYAIDFPGERLPAEDIHLAAAGHPEYVNSSVVAGENLTRLKKACGLGDLTGLLEVMQADAERAHSLFKKAGVEVITEDMRRLCDAVGKEGDFPVYWNVAGARTVYVFTTGEFQADARRLLEELNLNYARLKVAGPAFTKYVG